MLECDDLGAGDETVEDGYSDVGIRNGFVPFVGVASVRFFVCGGFVYD